MSQLLPRLTLPFGLDTSVVDIAFSPLIEPSILGEDWKGGDQQEEQCNGLAGAAENGKVDENLDYSKTVQCAKVLYPFLGISCGGNEKKLWIF
jgi:hypothetical protein